MKKLNVKKILKITVPVAIASIAGGAVYLIGHRTGWTDCERVISNGVGKCWEQDPTLQEHMMNVAMNLSGNSKN